MSQDDEEADTVQADGTSGLGCIQLYNVVYCLSSHLQLFSLSLQDGNSWGKLNTQKLSWIYTTFILLLPFLASWKTVPQGKTTHWRCCKKVPCSCVTGSAHLFLFRQGISTSGGFFIFQSISTLTAPWSTLAVTQHHGPPWATYKVAATICCVSDTSELQQERVRGN